MTRHFAFVAAVLAVVQLGCRAVEGNGGGPDSGAIGADGGGSITWYRDVLPIVQTSCQNCHSPGGIAPFQLLTYEDGANHASLIGAAVAQGLMPPWKPSESCQSFQHDRSISAAQQQTITDWVSQGAVAGDPNDAPPPHQITLPQLPRVDASLNQGFDYTPSSLNGPDDYHCTILDPQLTTTQFVVGVNIVPGQASLVHHVILFEVSKADADAANVGGKGWTCFGGPGTSNNNLSMVGGWVPGAPPMVTPAGTGLRLDPGNVIVMQVHYNLSSAAAQPDRTVAQLMYAPSVAKEAQVIGPIDTSFSIPPNAVGYSDSMTITVPQAVTLWGVQPHMHLKGKTINVSVNMNGADTCLVDVPKWDFYWQQMYFYDQPISVPNGASLTLKCSWDNPTNQNVTFGEGTSDEMCLAFFYLTL